MLLGRLSGRGYTGHSCSAEKGAYCHSATVTVPVFVYGRISIISGKYNAAQACSLSVFASEVEGISREKTSAVGGRHALSSTQ